MFLIRVMLKHLRANIAPIIAVIAIMLSATVGMFSQMSQDVSANMVEISGTNLEVIPTKQALLITLPCATSETIQTPSMVTTTEAPTTQPPTTELPATQAPTTEVSEVEDEVADEEDDSYESSSRTYLETYSLTAYCPCYSCSEGWGRQTSSGHTATAGRTVACNSIRAGTWIYIEGYGTYRVEDVGGGLGSHTIDIFFDSHWETEEFGRRSADVYLLD